MRISVDQFDAVRNQIDATNPVPIQVVEALLAMLNGAEIDKAIGANDEPEEGTTTWRVAAIFSDSLCFIEAQSTEQPTGPNAIHGWVRPLSQIQALELIDLFDVEGATGSWAGYGTRLRIVLDASTRFEVPLFPVDPTAPIYPHAIEPAEGFVAVIRERLGW